MNQVVLIIIGVVALLMITGMVVSSREKKNAPRYLQKAKTELEANNHLEALSALRKAFYVPLNEHFSKDHADLTYQAIILLEQILATQEPDGSLSLGPLKEALQSARINGGSVPEKLTKPVQEFLEGADHVIEVWRKTNSLDQTLNDIPIEEGDENDFTAQLQEGTETEAVNTVGQMLLKGKVNQAIDYLNPLIERAGPAFKATLLEQRAGCYLLRKEPQKAEADYRAILELYPCHQRTLENIEEIKPSK